MATNPLTLPENAGRITDATVDYAYGSAKNDSTGTTGDGTPIQQALMNDHYGLQQALLRASGIVPSGDAETQQESQYLQCIVEQSAGRAMTVFEKPESLVNEYVVGQLTNNHAPQERFTGMRIQGSLLASNTASGVSIDAFGLGPSPVRNLDNSFISPGQIRGGEFFEAVFIGGAYILLSGNGFDSKLKGKSFNGRSIRPDFGVTANDIEWNSEYYYDTIIPGVTPNATPGILTTIIGLTTADSVQTYTILAVGGAQDQRGQVFRRFRVSGNIWGSSWENITPGFRGCLVYPQLDVPIPSGVYTTMPFDGGEYDRFQFHSASTNNSRFTVNGPLGYVKITANISFVSNNVGVRSARFLKNGSRFFAGNAFSQFEATSAGGAGFNISTSPVLAQDGDYFEVEVFHNVGSPLSVDGGSQSTWFAIEKV